MGNDKDALNALSRFFGGKRTAIASRGALVPVEEARTRKPSIVGYSNASLFRDNRSSGPTTVDACSKLFDVCRSCEQNYLKSLGVACYFDVDGGVMPQATFNVVSAIIETLVEDISNNWGGRSRGATLTLTLRRKDTVWIMAVAEKRISSVRSNVAARRASLVRGLVQSIGGTCRTQETDEGLITAFVFMTTTAPEHSRAYH